MVIGRKILTALSLGLGALLGQGDACSCARGEMCDYIEGSDVVLHATVLSRSDQEDINDDVTYTVSTIATYKSEPDISCTGDVSFVTGGHGGVCGLYLVIGEEYLLYLSRSDYRDGQLAGNSCVENKNWSLVTTEELEILENGTCSEEDYVCELSCGEFQECLVYLEGTEYEEEYCADVCDPNPCADDEICELVQIFCIALVGVICSPVAQCNALSTASSP